VRRRGLESLGRFGRQRFYHRYVLHQLWRDAVPFLQIARAVVGNPNSSLRVLPNQNLQRQIDRHTGRRLH
jgi:hypothetical protein